MATKPKIVTYSTASRDIINAIRNSGTTNYQNYVPILTADAENLREIGTIIMDNPDLQNEFLHSLVNRIGKVILDIKSYTNPYAMFKQGVLELGETIEDIFVEMAKPFDFDIDTASNEVFKIETPDVRTAFYVVNYEHFYKVTIQSDELEKAFLSMDGVTSLITKIIDSMYKGANYDEFMTTKYMLARRILNGQMTPITIPTVSTENMKPIVSAIKGVSNDLEFMNNEYNLSKVYTTSEKAEQYVFVNTKFDAEMSVEVLASAFNMDKAEFSGHRILIDGFGKLDIARLGELFANDPTYHEFSQDEMDALNEIPAVLVDRTFFKIWDKLVRMDEQKNAQGQYWNYFYHKWMIFATSPFANAVVFVPETPTVTSVTVSPSTASLKIGQSLSLTATVVTEGFAPQTVTWTVDNENAEITASGILSLKEGASGTVEVTATSVWDSTKKGTATITVA